MLYKSILICLFTVLIFGNLFGQVENVPISNPVYQFLERAESKGYLDNTSLSDLPLQKKVIINCLKKIRENVHELSDTEIKILEQYESAFGLSAMPNAVLIYSESDSTQIFSSELFGEKNKYFYRHKDDQKEVTVLYLAELDSKFELNQSKRNSLLANQGFRISGTIANKFGFQLQATNGTLISGDREFAKEDEKLRQNVKFSDLNSDFDYTESQVAFEYNWFYASIGRESRKLGAGIDQALFVSTHSPASDAISLAARFDSFEYKFTHSSLLSQSLDTVIDHGFIAVFPPKYSVMHRASFRSDWLEFALWENVIYSNRNVDLAYLNPFSFLKSLEHALHDRDNSLLGMDFTLRPINNFQVKGCYLLDDIIFSKIGTGFWSNKAAWNIAMLYSLDFPIDLGLEYSRVEPYTFSHFNFQNAYTNDNYLFGSIIPPNSDYLTFRLNYWIYGRYPLVIKLSRFRHGRNVLDDKGNIIKNVGGDFLVVRDASRDSENVTFLDGDLVNQTKVELSYAWEFINGFHLHFLYGLDSDSEIFTHYGRIIFKFQDF